MIQSTKNIHMLNNSKTVTACLKTTATTTGTGAAAAKINDKNIFRNCKDVNSHFEFTRAFEMTTNEWNIHHAKHRFEIHSHK